MLTSLLYVLLSILGLSFLIFIHELGHYIMARRVGMRVEVFSIGFGKPIYSWERKGVKWQIGWLLFGGYVKIAGADLDKEKNPYEIPDGFFGKSPLDRIKVAVMGPVANLVFAILAFTALWMVGGRDKNFSELTDKIGWVDPKSELYALGVRPGDEVTAYNKRAFQSAKDHIYAPMIADKTIDVAGLKVDYTTKEKEPFDHVVKVYTHPESVDPDVLTSGILHSANYIIYDRLPNGQENPLPEGSPLAGSGIQYGDRILWVNGEFIFSIQQLNQILNSHTALLTIERGGKTLLVRVPRVQAQELKPNAEFREELTDWQFAAGLNGTKLPNLYTIPYNLTSSGVVEHPIKFIDKEKQDEFAAQTSSTPLESPLQSGDKIIAVNGTPITHASDLLKLLQVYKVNIIVQRNQKPAEKPSFKEADAQFDQQIQWNDLDKIISHLGTATPVQQQGNYLLLKPVVPKTRNDFLLNPETSATLATDLQEQRNAINAIPDPDRRNQALKLLEQQEKRLLLGLPNIQDRHVQYNPSPFVLFANVSQEISRTLTALISGTLNPKWIVGPVGIVQVVHDTSMTSLKEALYWLGAISLNLGLLNLLPIPVLDGGTILMSLLEMVTRKRLSPKTLEKLVIPFAVFLIGFFVFLTYNDLRRLFSHFF